jgi:hypothetical protein
VHCHISTATYEDVPVLSGTILVETYGTFGLQSGGQYGSGAATAGVKTAVDAEKIATAAAYRGILSYP